MHVDSNPEKKVEAKHHQQKPKRWRKGAGKEDNKKYTSILRGFYQGREREEAVAVKMALE
jgi:hypothetical protein